MARRSLCSFRSFTVGWKNSNCIIVEIFNSYLLRIHFVTKYCQIGEIVDPSSMHNFQYSLLIFELFYFLTHGIRRIQIIHSRVSIFHGRGFMERGRNNKTDGKENTRPVDPFTVANE